MAAAGPEPEKTAVGNLGRAFPSGPSGQDVGLAQPSCGNAPAAEVGDEVEDGVVLTACLPRRGDAWVGDGPGPPASADKDPENSCAPQGEEEDTGEAGEGPETEHLLPEGGGEGTEGLVPASQHEGSWRTETEQGSPVGKDEGRRDYVCLLEEEEEEDRALGSEKQEATVMQPHRLPSEGDAAECPICTEPYDPEGRPPALLNCSHALCARCLRAILEAASEADIGRVRCPLCRQKTPMMEWAICRHQEELMLLGTETQSPVSAGPPTDSYGPLPARRPGFWGGLEHRFQVRFRTTRMVGFLPCLRYPARLIRGLARLEAACPAGYRLALLGLLLAESLSLFLVFLPIVFLLLLFLILDR